MLSVSIFNVARYLTDSLRGPVLAHYNEAEGRVVTIRETRDSHLNDFHKFQRLWRSSRGLLSSLAIMPSAPLTTPPPNKQFTLHPKQYHQMFHIFMILIEVLHPPPPPHPAPLLSKLQLMSPK